MIATQLLSIELCENFRKRLDPNQKKEIKIGALIAVRNLIKNTKVNDSIIYSFLIDTIADPDKEIREWVIKIIKDITRSKELLKEIKELLEIKLYEVNNEAKPRIINLLRNIVSIQVGE